MCRRVEPPLVVGEAEAPEEIEVFFFSSRRRHTRCGRDWSSDVCSSDLPLIEGYLGRTPRLAGVVQLLDIRREPNEDDVSMLDFLSALELPTIVVLTKADKISRAQAEARTAALASGLGVDADQTIRFSAA